jgi:hypothetical protein
MMQEHASKADLGNLNCGLITDKRLSHPHLFELAFQNPEYFSVNLSESAHKRHFHERGSTKCCLRRCSEI